MTFLRFGYIGRSLLISLALHGVLLWSPPWLRLSDSSSGHPLFVKGGGVQAHLQRPAKGQITPIGVEAPRVPLAVPMSAVQVLPQRVQHQVTHVVSPVQKIQPTAVDRSDRTAAQANVDKAFEGDPFNENGLDANGLREYRIGLAVAARRFRSYPPQALQKRWGGHVDVLITVETNGVVQLPQLLHSSGHSEFDVAALEMVGQALKHTVIPSSLYSQRFSIPLSIDFKGL